MTLRELTERFIDAGDPVRAALLQLKDANMADHHVPLTIDPATNAVTAVGVADPLTPWVLSERRPGEFIITNSRGGLVLTEDWSDIAHLQCAQAEIANWLQHFRIIVRAVNAHGAMLHALEMVRDAQADIVKDGGVPNIPPIALATIEQAIALAKAE